MRDQRGASSVEYALIVFAVAALIAAVVFAFGLVNDALFKSSCTELEGAVAPTSASCP